jgi:phage/plasmid-like protein (TIGR03299 family)
MQGCNIQNLEGQSIYSTAEAVTAAGLNWEVDDGRIKLETYDRETGTNQWVDLDSHKGVFRKDAPGRGLGQCVVGQGFELVQNTEAFRCFDKILSAQRAQFVSGGHYHNGASVFLQCRLPYEANIGNGDTTERYLLIAQGHTGQQALTMKFTHIRPVCSNTLFAALRDSKYTFSLKHTKNYKNKLEQAVEYMKEGLGHLDHVEKKFNQMAVFGLSEKEQMNYLKLCYDRPIDEDLKDWRKWGALEFVYHNAKGKNKSEGTIWHGFNVVTEYEDHHAPVNNPRGRAGIYQEPAMVSQGRQVRALFGNSTVSRKTKAFALADDVIMGRLDLKTGRKPGKKFAGISLGIGAGAAAVAGQHLLTF